MKHSWKILFMIGMTTLVGCHSNASLNSNLTSSNFINDSFSSSTVSASSSSVAETTNSKLTLLENIDIKKALGVTKEANWSFAMHALGNIETAYSFDFISLISNQELFYTKVGSNLYIEDLLGLRKNEDSNLGIDCFGKGLIGIELKYTLPNSDAKETIKDFNIGIEHDADWFYILNNNEEVIEQKNLNEFKNYFNDKLNSRLTRLLVDTASVIPESLAKGLDLRFAVEKLLDLGFVIEINDTSGLVIHLQATTHLFSDLLNDVLEEIIPTEWLQYLPRTDIEYHANQFDISLVFDEQGIFKKYIITNDMDFGITFTIRNLFSCSSHIFSGGTFSITSE